VNHNTPNLFVVKASNFTEDAATSLSYSHKTISCPGHSSPCHNPYNLCPVEVGADPEVELDWSWIWTATMKAGFTRRHSGL
jgi:hypothetical protein